MIKILLFFCVIIFLNAINLDDVNDTARTLRFLIIKLKNEIALKKEKLQFKKSKVLQEIYDKARILDLFKYVDGKYQQDIKDYESEIKNYIANEKVINDETHMLGQALLWLKKNKNLRN